MFNVYGYNETTLSHEYFEKLLLIITQELLVESQLRASDVFIYIILLNHPRIHTGESTNVAMPLLLILLYFLYNLT